MSANDNLANAFCNWMRAEFLSEFSPNKTQFRTQSPIEWTFIQALLLASLMRRIPFSLTANEKIQRDIEVGVRSQVVLLDWPVDFVVSVFDAQGCERRLAIECDGHDFHERTKEQARKDRSRDRRLQEAGYTVFRFTGSEIYRDAWACVQQVASWVCATSGRNAVGI